jgi:tRNA-Thr(GGU) m(6)t(6)A37 methyltransferase TsaA
MRLTQIGTVHSPFRDPRGMPIQPDPEQGAEGTVVVDESLRDGLRDLEGFSHLVLLTWLHQARGYDLAVVPFLDSVPRGVFATRAPRRPNPIGLSVVRLLGVDGATLRVVGVDCLDGTPLLDIKPFVPAFDAPTGVRLGWLEGRDAAAARTRSDGRFAGPSA